MKPTTCKNALIPQFILTLIVVQASSFAILAWGDKESVLDHYIVAAIMIGLETLHYSMLFTAVKSKVVSEKVLSKFQIAELIFVIPFVAFLIFVIVKDWPIVWVHLYVAMIQVLIPTVRFVFNRHMKTN